MEKKFVHDRESKPGSLITLTRQRNLPVPVGCAKRDLKKN